MKATTGRILRTLTVLAAAACAITAVALMMKTACCDSPGWFAMLAPALAAVALLQTETAITKLADPSRRRTHRWPWGDAGLSVTTASIALMSLPVPPAAMPALMLTVSATGLLGFLALFYWTATCLQIYFVVDESKLPPGVPGSRPASNAMGGSAARGTASPGSGASSAAISRYPGPPGNNPGI